VRVEELTSVTPDLAEAMSHLLGQLSSSAPPLGPHELQDLVDSPTTRLLVARDADGDVVGCLTLAVFRIPTGVRAWIEDVVVDQTARNQGVGEALSRHALKLAEGAGARTVELTSRPEREAANRLYARLGFESRDTNVYRFTFPRP
jgi:ribosomal protein S18 acetylase RimI-like enzyme